MECVQELFLAMLPMRLFEWPDGLFSLEEQKTLLHMTLGHPLCKQYPPSLHYQKQFLKKIMKQAEQRGMDVAEEVYTSYAALVVLPDSPTVDCYKSYRLCDHDFITLKESTQLVSRGTTGLVTWQAAFFFVAWIMENKFNFSQKNILELGSGVGYAGIALCRLCQPSSYCFTDCHSEVLQALTENVGINLTAHGHTTTGVAVEVLNLDWTNNLKDFMETHEAINCIIATDVIYDIDVIDAFVSILRALLNNYKEAIVYVASTLRNPETYQYFSQKIESACISMKALDGPSIRTMYLLDDQPVMLCELIAIQSTCN